MNQELPHIQAGFRNGRETRNQVANICWIIEKAKEFQKIIYSYFIDYWLDCVDHKTWEILNELEISDHLTCLLRNLYADQEATVRMGHGPKHWLKIGKAVHQSCILSPGLFNYVKSISWELPCWMIHKLESRFPGKIPTISDIQMIPPEWQKTKSNVRASWWGWKRESEKAGLKLNIQKSIICPITSWQIDG